MEWQDINTTPNEEWVLVYAGKSKYPQAWIARRSGNFFSTQDDSSLLKNALTHWMPLPPPPSEAK